MKFKNLTPHSITIELEGKKITLASEGLARVTSTSEQVGELDGIPVYRQVFGAVEGLPQEQEGVTLVVSAMVLSALAGTRSDCVAPKTDATAVRNESGQIIAVRGFVC